MKTITLTIPWIPRRDPGLVKSFVPTRFEIVAKGWLSRLLLRLGLFRYKVILNR